MRIAVLGRGAWLELAVSMFSGRGRIIAHRDAVRLLLMKRCHVQFHEPVVDQSLMIGVRHRSERYGPPTPRLFIPALFGAAKPEPQAVLATSTNRQGTTR